MLRLGRIEDFLRYFCVGYYSCVFGNFIGMFIDIYDFRVGDMFEVILNGSFWRNNIWLIFFIIDDWVWLVNRVGMFFSILLVNIYKFYSICSILVFLGRISCMSSFFFESIFYGD